jgi:hypothetical protein
MAAKTPISPPAAPTMAEIAPSQRLSPDRAPRLRRIAQLVDQNAERSFDPGRARKLACEMRLRAAAIESGDDRTRDEKYDELEASIIGHGF